MIKIYILCKNNINGIDDIVKVFSNKILALKELYRYAGFYCHNEEKFVEKFMGNDYHIECHMIDECHPRQYICMPNNLKYVKHLITKDIWLKIIDELPDNKTFNKLVLLQK
jgi:hypothetical protein